MRQQNRDGNFTYTIPGLTPGASYNVRLDFAEGTGLRPGRNLQRPHQRQPGPDQLRHLRHRRGEDKGVAESFTARPAAPGGHVQFVTVEDNAKVNGIEIRPFGGTSPTPSPSPPRVTRPDRGTGRQPAGRTPALGVGPDPTYSATRPPGRAGDTSTTGLISGTPSTAGTPVSRSTATDTTGAKGTASFTWTVNSGTAATGGVYIAAGGRRRRRSSRTPTTPAAPPPPSPTRSPSRVTNPAPQRCTRQPVRQLHLHHPRPHRRRSYPCASTSPRSTGLPPGRGPSTS